MPIRVVNPTSKAIKLRRDDHLANLDAVDASEQVLVVGSSTLPASHVGPVVDSVEVFLTDEEKNQFQGLLERYSDVFSQGENDLGRTTIVKHMITTPGSAPTYTPTHCVASSQSPGCHT